ncbi:MAG: response regulator [Deltaproteobacteria bacterium]|nr:response regulator [Deltaproteobacteria bacterium]
MYTTAFDQRPSGIPAAAALPWGSHFCVFFASPQELLDVLVPFVRAGLGANELCCWEVRAPLTVEQAREALAAAVPDFAARVARGQLELVAAPPDGTATAPGGAAEGLERRLDRAILAGFDGLRLVRHAEPGAAGRALPADFETIRRLNVVAAVPFPRARLGAVALLQIVQDHRFALVCNSGRWEVLQGSEANSARDALQRSEEKLALLFRNMSEAFAYHRILLDERGKPCDYVFLEVNPAFERLTGLAARDILGRRVTRVLPGIENDPTDWIGRYGRVALTGEPVRFESHAEPLDRWYGVSAFSPHKGYFAVTFADITDRKRAEAERAAANLRLVESDRRKNDFLAVLSHELRNPLAPISNSLYVLGRAAPGGNQAQRAREVIERQVAQLTRLVDDLLDVTRISRNKIQLQRERVDLCDLVRRSAEDQRSLFDRNEIRLETDVPDEALCVIADRSRVAQVIGNLLQNAAKFTGRGGAASVSVRADDERRHAVVRVVDTGVGMTPETLHGLFQPFVQAERTLDRSKGGLGLGLALVKGLVELHGGEVRACSEGLGKGSGFTVRLPLESGAVADRCPEPAAAERRRRRVLVIEDNIDAAETLREALEFGEHEVAVAYNGPEGLAKARAFRPEVVLCDIGLPGMDGYEVARAFRGDDALRDIRLVALSGYAQPEDLQRAREAGFEHHLAKPPSLERIEELLASVPAGSGARGMPDVTRG